MAVIPFLDVQSVGIYLTSKCISWVEIKKRGGASEVEIISQGSVDINQTLKAAISECRERLSKENQLVYLTASKLRYDVHVDDHIFYGHESKKNDWLLNVQEKAILASSFESPDLCSFNFELNDDQIRVISVVYDADEINEYIALFKECGLPLYGITTPIFCDANPLVFSTTFAQSNTVYIYGSNTQSALIYYNNGVLEDVLIPTEKYKDIPHEEINIIKNRNNAPDLKLTTNLKFEQNKAGQYKLANRDDIIAKAVKSEDLITAYGAGVLPIFSGLDHFNLIPDFIRGHAKDNVEKTDFIKLALGLIILCFIICGSVLAWKYVLDEDISRMKYNVSELTINSREYVSNQSIFESKIDSANKMITILNSSLNPVFIFEAINKALPESAYLEEINISSQDSTVTIVGYSSVVSDHASIISRILANELVGNARLINSRLVNSGRIQSANNSERITQFTIQFNYRN